MTTPSPTAPEQTFDASLELHGSDGGVFLTVPFSVEEVYGQRGTLHVRGTIDGFPFRLPLQPASDGTHTLTVHKQIRNAIDKTWGQEVHVTLAPDTEESPLDIPEELTRALDLNGLRAKFEQLSYAQRKEYAQWITRAKKYETRAERVSEAIERIKIGRRFR
ncbi:YdeI/OmpD-associated family protein [Hymenobacter sp. HD11105]